MPATKALLNKVDNVGSNQDSNGDDSGLGDRSIEDSGSVESELFQYPNWESLGTFDSDDLNDDQIFILAPKADQKIYVWIGFDSVEETREDPEMIGLRFLEDNKWPKDTQIIVVAQGSEPEEFWKYFVNG